MKAVGIIGYKKSGKTTLVVSLAQELSRRDYKVATIKHTSKGIDLLNSDTAEHKKYAKQVAAISPGESAIFFNSRKSLENIAGYMEADFLLVEGFKKEKTFPKIICLKDAHEAERLFDGLETCAATISPLKIKLGVPVFSILNDIEKIADLVEEKAFKLPNLNCGSCGHKTCYGLAKEIVEGKKSIEDCVSSNPTTQVILNGQMLALNPFAAKIIRNTIKGALSALKGFKWGKVEIKIDERRGRE